MWYRVTGVVSVHQWLVLGLALRVWDPLPRLLVAMGWGGWGGWGGGGWVIWWGRGMEAPVGGPTPSQLRAKP